MRRIGTVGIALLGIAFSVQAVIGLLTAATFLFDAGRDTALPVVAYLSSFVPVVVLGVAGALLIIYRERLAVSLFGADDELSVSVDPLSALRIGMFLLGLYVAVYAVSHLANSLLAPIVSSANDQMLFGTAFTEKRPLSSFLPPIAASVAELVLGCVLIWWADGLSTWLWTHRRPERALSSSAVSACPACGATYDPTDYVPGAPSRCVECGQSLDSGAA